MPSDVIYHSSSKGDVRIGDMATPWALNAWRKDRAKGDTEVGRALEQELRARGCTLDEESGRWTVPQKSEEATP